MRTLKEGIKDMTKEELEGFVVQWNQFYVDFDEFIRQKAGAETYRMWIHEFCSKRTMDWLKDVKVESVLNIGEDDEGELS